MNRFFLLTFSFLLAWLDAGLFNHLKPAANKFEEPHSMRGIDFIYVINLDQRPQKFALCKEQLLPYGINPYRFSAVNGWELSFDQINDVGVKFAPWMDHGLMATSYLPQDGGLPHHEKMQVYGRNYFCHCMARGTIGIALSHISVLKDAYDSGFETIWVMEDDIEVIQNPHYLSDLIAELDLAVGKNGWDILFTDQDTKGRNGQYVSCYSFAPRPDFVPLNKLRFAQRRDINALFRKVGARYGAYSMIVRRSGMQKLLNFFQAHPIFLPYDMDYTLPDSIQLYTVRHDVVSTLPEALTDNGAPNYK